MCGSSMEERAAREAQLAGGVGGLVLVLVRVVGARVAVLFPRLRRAAAGGALRPAIDVCSAVAELGNGSIGVLVGCAGASSGGWRRCGAVVVGVGFGGFGVRRRVPERQ